MSHRIRWWAVMVLLLGAIAAPAANAASYLDRAFGTPELGVSARLRGMGGAGGALGDGALGLIDNPVSAVLGAGMAPDAVHVQLSGRLARMSENRFVPLYDTFDSYVHDTAIAVNDHAYGALDAGVAFAPRQLAGVVLGLASVEAWDPRYHYYDERRSTATTDQIVSESFITTQGTLRATSLSFSRAFPHGLAGGAAVHWYSGTITDRDALVPRQSGISGRVTETRRTLHGASLSLGLAWRANERLTGAVAWESGPELTAKLTSWQDDIVVAGPDEERTEFRPARVHVSGAYRPRNSVRTVFAADAVWSPWSQVTLPSDPGFELLDTWDLRFGLEHRYLRDVSGRIGFRYERSPLLREADRAWFTFGTGWHVDRYALNAALEVGKRTSRQEPLWPRAQQAGAVGAGLDRVEDTAARMSLGLEVRL